MSSRRARRSAVGSVVVAALMGVWGAGAAQAVTINPTGGTTATNGFRIDVAPDASEYLINDNVRQFFTYQGPSVALGSTMYVSGSVNQYERPAGTAFTPISQSAVTGAGTAASPYRVVTVLGLGTSGVTLTATQSYIYPQFFYGLDLTLRNTSTTDYPSVKLYRLIDTYLSGGDTGAGYKYPDNPWVAVRKNGIELGQYAASPIDHYYSAYYGTQYSQVAGGGNLLDTIDPNVATDNGIGVQWNLSLPAGATVSRTVGTGRPDGALLPDVTPVTAATTFDPQRVGTTSAGTTFTFRNSGQAPLTVSSAQIGGTNTSDFAVTGGTCTAGPVAAGDTCTVTATFNPTAAGTRSATVKINDNTPAGSHEIAVSGVGQAPAVTVAPSPYGFGSLPVGTSASKTFTITNSASGAGAAPLAFGATGAVALAAAGSSAFTITGDTCTGTTVAAGSTCQVTVTFAPTIASAASTTLRLTDDAPVAGTTQTVAITGSGAQPGFSVNPGAKEFGEVDAGATREQVFTVTNSSSGSTGAPLHFDAVGSVTLVSDPVTDSALSITGNSCDGATVAPGATCTVTVRYAPTAAGPSTATLSFHDDAPAGNGTQTVAVTGHAIAPEASIDPAPFDFGTVRTQTIAAHTFTVANTASGPFAGPLRLGANAVAVTADGGAPFTLTDDTCSGKTVAPGDHCTVEVSYAPATPGAGSATLTVTGNGGAVSSALTGTGAAPVFTVDPYDQDFGDVRTGGSSDQTFTVTNASSGDTAYPLSFPDGAVALDGDAGYSVTADTCSDSTVAPGGTCAVTVRFAPTAAGTAAGTLSFTDDAPAPNTMQTVSLDGNGVQSGFGVDPATHDFGAVRTGATATRTFTVTNTADGPTGAPLTFAATDAVSVDGGPTFTLSSDSCSGHAIAAGESCQVEVTYAPTATGDDSATLTLDGDDPDSPHTVALSGSGVSAGFAVSPASVDFGHIRTGTTAEQTLTVTNDASGDHAAALDFPSNDALAITGDDAASFTVTGDTCSGTAVAPGETCAVTVSYAPTALGHDSATLSLTDDAPGSPHTVPLQGTGAAPAFSVDPGVYDFGSVHTSTARTETFTVTNSADADTGLPLSFPQAGVTVSGDDTFTITDDTCSGASVDPGQTCAVKVRFLPTSTDASTATLAFGDNAAGAPHTVALSGTGAVATFSVAPASRDFGTVHLGESLTQTLVVTNTSTGRNAFPLTFRDAGAVALAPADDTPYSITADSCTGASVPSGGTCSVTVRYAPTTLGQADGELTFTNDGPGSQSVALTGIGALPEATVDPAVKDFGSVRAGTAASQTFSVTNTAKGATALPLHFPASGAVAISAPDGTPFSVTADTCTGATVAPGGACGVTVQFAPSTAAAFGGKLVLTDDAGPSTQTVALSGTGGEPAFAVTPAAKDFGGVRTGTSATQAFTVTNSSAGPTAYALTFPATGAVGIVHDGDTPFTVTGDSCTGHAIDPGATCQVVVTYSPVAPGQQTAALQLTSDAPAAAAGRRDVPSTTRSLPLAGTGTQPAFAVDPSRVALGPVTVGAARSQTFTVTNTAGGPTAAPLVLGAISLARGGSTQFTVRADGCSGRTLAPGASCTVTVTFAPLSAGADATTLRFADDAPGAPHEAQLGGTGVAAPVTPPVAGTGGTGKTPAPKLTCASRRVFTVHLFPVRAPSQGGLRIPGRVSGARILSAVLDRGDGKLVRYLRHTDRTVTADLRRLARGPYTVTARVRLATGKAITVIRTYRSCF